MKRSDLSVENKEELFEFIMQRKIITSFKRSYLKECCWRWPKNGYQEDYAHLRIQGKTYILIRIMVYLKENVKLNGKWLACHKCDTQFCINPDHLYAGTPSQNLKDYYRDVRIRTNDFALSDEDYRLYCEMMLKHIPYQEIYAKFNIPPRLNCIRRRSTIKVPFELIFNF